MTTPIHLTKSGLVSRVDHLVIHAATADGSTVIRCLACGDQHREEWPGSVARLEDFADAHLHDVSAP